MRTNKAQYCIWSDNIGRIVQTSSQTMLHEPIPCYWLCKTGKSLSWQSKDFNTLRPIQNDRLFADDVFQRNFYNENVWILLMISLKFVPKGPINNIPSLVQIMACTAQATSHYLKQWWLEYWRIYALLGLNELTVYTISSNCTIYVVTDRD